MLSIFETSCWMYQNTKCLFKHCFFKLANNIASFLPLFNKKQFKEKCLFSHIFNTYCISLHLINKRNISQIYFIFSILNKSWIITNCAALWWLIKSLEFFFTFLSQRLKKWFESIQIILCHLHFVMVKFLWCNAQVPYTGEFTWLQACIYGRLQFSLKHDVSLHSGNSSCSFPFISSPPSSQSPLRQLRLTICRYLYSGPFTVSTNRLLGSKYADARSLPKKQQRRPL